ncbi:efflux RND transporter periplasmic adaptor subunit [Aestuariirhabdus sp. Z084]|uniref:efflux RND transporter periplasmic adaptor subunit n=1 Tax=Aestuariirhabdus haliotis TaxID=2918751 RepID=UPI00201B3E4D|nr:efflux RND transporter periplasmic adaptor subunit [Aestuariirhabdus haliotis]MCL6416917.1 efflux RND transporter periplasmic adaptor subunit [Aestuariirhabdus haliotis]MCL6420921.1 efflux RND transporter periplasmic adaptor subunit [Aestuariirhabdus haliotis]
MNNPVSVEPDTSLPKQRRRWPFVVLSLMILGGAIGWLNEPPPETPMESRPRALLPVSLVELRPQATPLKLHTTGLTEPRWATEMAAAVEGRVLSLANPLEPGTRLRSGQVLVTLEASPYLAAREDAQMRLAAARLSQARAQHEQKVALKMGGRLLTPLAKHKPQIEAAKAATRAAQSALEHAQQRLDDTRIQAPFDAIVLERSVTPGQWVESGVALLKVAASDSLDVRVRLSDSSWQQLTQLDTGVAVRVVTEQGQQWPAQVRYVHPSRDPNTRQRLIVLKVPEPYDKTPSLLPDQQVDVWFDTPLRDDIFTAPASALTHDGYVWTLNDKDQLRPEAVELLSSTQDHIQIRFLQNPKQPRRLVRYPLSSMLAGQQVTPRLEVDLSNAAAIRANNDPNLVVRSQP